MGPHSWESSLLVDPGANFFSGKRGTRKKRKGGKKKKNIFAMRTVEFNQAMSGREGAQLPPLPPRPPTLLILFHCDVLLNINKRGHF
jgi:hypothetical protein